MTFHCRACDAVLAPPALCYPDMPDRSQHLPEHPGRTGIELRVAACPACGLVQLANPPVPYFREVIRASAYSPEMAEFRRVQFRDWINRNNLAGKRLVEIGCGRGEYLKLMRESAPVEAVGIEYGDNAGAAAAKLYLETGDETIPGAPYDGFFILNYLEHLPNLRAVLRGIRNNLVPGGKGLVEVPNYELMRRNRLFTEFTIDHLCYFTPETLKKTLEINGFSVQTQQTVWHEYILSAEVTRRDDPDFTGFCEAGETLRRMLRERLSPYPREAVAVWGAGHQAFAVLAVCGLADKVGCILDSADFKQGKFAPGTGLPIRSPEILGDSAIRMVLIMAGGYSDEIAARLRTRYGTRFELMILRENRVETL